MSDLSPETEKLLALARGAGTLTDARRAQIKAGLMAQVAAGGAVGGVASHALWGKAAWFSSPFVKGLSAVALLSAVGVGVYIGARPHGAGHVDATASTSVPVIGRANAAAAPMNDRNAPAPLGDTVARAVDPSAPQAPTSNGASASNGTPVDAIADTSAADTLVQPSSAHASANPNGRTSVNATRPGSSTAGASPSSAAAATNADTLAEETSLLRQADQALRAGDAQHALSLLNEDAARFPHGMLGPERAAEQMIARCQLGQIDAKTAQNYVTAHASSPFAARLADACHVSR